MRLSGLDTARFLAFSGMVLVNFRIAAGTVAGPDPASVLTTALEGRAAALFVVLAGVGLSLADTPRALIVRRAVFLFVIGLINLSIFQADILHYYALYFIVALPFLAAPNRVLWLGIAGFMAISLVALIALDYDRGWDWDTFTYLDFWTLQGFVRNALYNGWHPVFPWAAFLLIGMLIGRLDLASRRIQIRLLTWGAIGALAALVPGALTQDPELKLVFGVAPIPPGPFYILAGTGTAAATIGAILLITPALDRLALTPWLAAPGRQSLSLYVVHILLGMGTLEALDLLDGSLGPSRIFWISIGFCAACALYARIWSRWFRRGPLESLMRKTTEFGR